MHKSRYDIITLAKSWKMIETRNTKKLYLPCWNCIVISGLLSDSTLLQRFTAWCRSWHVFWRKFGNFELTPDLRSWLFFSVSAQSETFEDGDDQQDAGSPCAERISRAFDVSLQWPRVSMAIALLNLLPLSPYIRLSKSFNVGWNKTLLYMEVAGKNGSLLRSVIPAQNWSHNVDLGEGACAASNRSRTIERSIPCLTSALKALQNHSLTGQHWIVESPSHRMVAVGMPSEPIAVIFFLTHGNQSYALENLRIHQKLNLCSRRLVLKQG